MLSREDFIAATALFLASLAYLLSFYDYGLNLLDEGYLMMSSLRVMHGEVQYIDFQNNYGPGRFYFFAALFKLFGENFLVTRAAWVALYAFAAVLAYFIARRAVKPLYALIPAAMVVLTRCPWQKTFFVFLQVLCIWVFFLYLEKRKARLLAFCGLVTAVVMFFRQDIGVYAFIAFSFTLLVMHHSEGRKKAFAPLVYYAGSFILSFSPALIYYFARGSLFPMLDQFFLSGARDISASTLPFPGLRLSSGKGVVYSLGSVVVYIPLLVYAAGAYLLLRKPFKKELAGGNGMHILLLTSFGALIYLQLVNRTDLPHVWQIFPSACLLAVFLWADLTKNAAKPLKSSVTLVLLLILSCYLAAYFSRYNPQAPPWVLPKADYATLDIKGARVKIPGAYAESLMEVRKTIDDNTKDGDYILAVPDIPMLYFLCDRKNPLRYDLLRPGIADEPELQEGIIKVLKEKGILYMIYNDDETWDGVPERRFENRSRLVYDYLMSNYIKVKTVGGFSIWRRAS